MGFPPRPVPKLITRPLDSSIEACPRGVPGSAPAPALPHPGVRGRSAGSGSLDGRAPGNNGHRPHDHRPENASHDGIRVGLPRGSRQTDHEDHVLVRVGSETRSASRECANSLKAVHLEGPTFDGPRHSERWYSEVRLKLVTPAIATGSPWSHDNRLGTAKFSVAWNSV